MENSIPEIDERNLGPAMLALLPARRLFVMAKVFGGMNNSTAAAAAGYSTSSKSVVGVRGHELAHRPDVQHAIAEVTHTLMRCEGSNSIRTLIEIRDDKLVRAADRIKAALALLDRSGFHKITETHSTIDIHHLTDAQKDAKILSLCLELGIGKDEARKMLVAPQENVIDAVYSEVTPPELTEEEKEKKAAREHENEMRRQWNRMTPEEKAARKIALREAASERGKAERRKYREQENGDIPDAELQPVAELPDDLSDIL